VLITVVVSVALCCAGWYCIRVGYARTLARVAAITGSAALANDAAALSPNDAEAQATCGEVLGQTGSYTEALVAADRAVRLRPRDYYLWLQLGQAREQVGDQEGALRAFRQATEFAPSYANARWQLGNVLLRMGRLDEAFAELRRAGSSNPALLPSLADLAWGIYRPDLAAIAAAVKPSTDVEHMTLAITFAKHGENSAAVEQFVLSGAEAKNESQALLGLLLQGKAFNEAYQVWARTHGAGGADSGLGVVRDGGFEEPLLLGETGFAWQIARGLTNVTLSVDESSRRSGSKSLRIDFRGNSAPRSVLLTQTVLVAPRSTYRLTFAARGQQLVSAALPVVSIIDASDKTNTILAESLPVRTDSADWQELVIHFTPGPQTKAVIIAIRRQACSDDPCPAFGTVWWDSFTLGLAGEAGAGLVRKKIDALARS
jgi:tetratricopeptide (TPR) repeat protein